MNSVEEFGDGWFDLALAELFGVHQDGSPELEVLANFARSLNNRQHFAWQRTSVLPENTVWAEATFEVHDDAKDWVALNASFRSWPIESPNPKAAQRRIWKLWLSLEVACWCEQDHNVHRVNEILYEIGSVPALQSACDTAIVAIEGWLAMGVPSAESLRKRNGFPLRQQN